VADTLATLRTDIRYNIDEASANYWTDAEINQKVVNSYRGLWKRIMALRDDWFQSATAGTVSIKSGQNKYTSADGVPTDIYRIKSIRTTTSGKEFIRWIGKDQTSPEFVEGLRADISVNDPYLYLYDLVGNQTIFVSPTPREACTATVEYIVLPTDPSVDGSTFGVLDPFTDYIKSDATLQLLAKGPTGALEFWQNRKEEDWRSVLQTIGQPRQDQSCDAVQGVFD
jgi:hypothetical protein